MSNCEKCFAFERSADEWKNDAKNQAKNAERAKERLRDLLVELDALREKYEC